MDIPLIRRFKWATLAGAKKVNPKIKVNSNFIGVSGDSWNNPQSEGTRGCTVRSRCRYSFVAAGASNFGVFDAAEERKIRDRRGLQSELDQAGAHPHEHAQARGYGGL